jgi:hypothetical protein
MPGAPNSENKYTPKDKKQTIWEFGKNFDFKYGKSRDSKMAARGSKQKVSLL